MKNPHAPQVDFFCIGVGNSGTSWLAACLDEHPEITISKVKEPNFFVRKMSAFGGEENPWFMKNWNWYASQFSHAGDDDLIGDMSINLIHNIPEAPELIKQYYPEVKLIVLLRDPSRRIYAQYWHEKRYRRVSGIPETFAEAITDHRFLRRSNYYEFLHQWMQYFSKERFFILLDFELRADPSNMLRELYDFLGVNPDFLPPSLNERKNVASWGHPIYSKLYRVAKWMRFSGFEKAFKILKRLSINRLIRWLLVKPVPYPEMSPEIRSELNRYYLQDILNLESLIGRNLSPWKETQAVTN